MYERKEVEDKDHDDESLAEDNEIKVLLASRSWDLRLLLGLLIRNNPSSLRRHAERREDDVF
jgi:hypothetical protein